jgi:hypothetical protein
MVDAELTRLNVWLAVSIGMALEAALVAPPERCWKAAGMPGSAGMSATWGHSINREEEEQASCRAPIQGEEYV